MKVFISIFLLLVSLNPKAQLKPGFEPEEVPNPLAEENLLRTSGRGVFLMGEYADEVDYQDEGRKLILGFNLES